MSSFERILVSNGIEGVLEEALRLLRHKDGVGLTQVEVHDFDSLRAASVTLRFTFLPSEVPARNGGK